MTPQDTPPAAPQPSVTFYLCCTEAIELAPALADRPRLPLPRTSSGGILTVVLDLDNTLVFTRVLDVDSATVLVTLRPHLGGLLHWALAHCEVFVWTAGRRHYAAHAVQRMLDHFRLPRVPYLITRDDEGWYSDTEPSKDVQLLGRDMDCVVLVEDSVAYARRSGANCVLVPAYHGDPADDALLALTHLLRRMAMGGGRLGVPQFLRRHVAAALLLPSLPALRPGEGSIPPPPDSPPTADSALCHAHLDASAPMPKRSRRGAPRTEKRKPRLVNGQKLALRLLPVGETPPAVCG